MIGAIVLAIVAAQTSPQQTASPSPSSHASTDTDLGWVKPETTDLVRVLGMRWKLELSERKFLSAKPEEWTVPHISADRARVYAATTDGVLVARSVESNQPIWLRRDLGQIGASITEYHGQLLLGAASSLVLLDDQSGKEVSRTDVAGAVGGKIIVAGSIAIVPLRPNTFMAYDLEKKVVLWRTKRATPEGITLRGMATPAVDAKANRAYFGFSDGSLAAVDMATGNEVWGLSLGKSGGPGFADADAQPQIVDSGRAVIAASYQGGLYKLDAANGKVIWKREDLTRLTGLSTSGATGLVIATHGDRQVLGVYPESGKIRWRFRFKHGWPIEPVFLGGVLIAVGNADDTIAILDVTTGKPVQLISPGSGVSAQPTWREPDLAFLSNKGTLFMARLGAGTGITE